jgi:hypothetical protein
MAQKKISAKEAVADIKARIPDDEMMKKYGLSAKGLQSLFAKLHQAKLITNDEYNRRAAPSDQTLELVDEGGEKVSPAEKSLEVLKDFAEKFMFSRDDFERLKEASLKDVEQLMKKYNIPLSDSKELVKTLGTSTGSLLTKTTRKLRDGTQKLGEKVQQTLSSGEDQSSAQPRSSESSQEKIIRIGAQAVGKTTELSYDVVENVAEKARKFSTVLKTGKSGGFLSKLKLMFGILGRALYLIGGLLGRMSRTKSGHIPSQSEPLVTSTSSAMSQHPAQPMQRAVSLEKETTSQPRTSFGFFRKMKAVPLALAGFFVSLLTGQFLLKLVGYLVVLVMFVLSIAAISQRHELNLKREAEAWVRVDPLPKAEELYKAGQICDALEYLDYFRDFDYVKENPKVEEFYKKIKEERNSYFKQIKQVGSGIWTGKGDCIESTIAATASDLIGVGSVRTLAEWGWDKYHGEKTDDFAACLATVDATCTGFALVGIVGAPWTMGGSTTLTVASVPVKATTISLRIADKVGKLAVPFRKALTAVFVKAAKEKSTKPMASLINSMGRIKNAPGLKGKDALTVISHAKDPKDLERLADVAHAFGKNTGKFLTLGGDKSIQIHSRFHNDPQMVPALNHALQYGDKGTNAVMRHGPAKFLQALAPNKAVMGTRTLRSIWEGHLTEVLMYIMKLIPVWVMYLIAAVSGLVVIGIPSMGVYRAWWWLRTPA